MTPFSLRPFVSNDIPEALDLWRNLPGLGLGLSDEPDDLIAFLQRNPGLSQVALDRNQLIGAVLCGHDGRRGFLYHLGVAPDQQRNGIGGALVEACIDRLNRIGIARTTIHLFGHNDSAQNFWQSIGWKSRSDLVVLQYQS